MQDRSPMTPPANMPWSHAFRVAELAARKPTRFTMALDEAALAALAADLGLLGCAS